MEETPVGIPPEMTPETAAFWSAAAEGKLVIERCDACGVDAFPPRGICRNCRSRSMSPIEVTGRGRIYSFTINYQRWLPDLEVPFAVVLVEFPDHPGVRVVGRLRGCEPGQVAIDDEVEVGFEPGPGGYAVPSFVMVKGA
jgi:uncharacterized OB-fold protein